MTSHQSHPSNRLQETDIIEIDKLALTKFHLEFLSAILPPYFPEGDELDC